MRLDARHMDEQCLQVERVLLNGNPVLLPIIMVDDEKGQVEVYRMKDGKVETRGDDVLTDMLTGVVSILMKPTPDVDRLMTPQWNGEDGG